MSFTAKIVSGSGVITCVIGGKVYSVSRDHWNYPKIFKAFKENDSETFIIAHDLEQQFKNVETNSGGKVKLIGETIYYNDKPLHNSMTNRMIQLLREGQDINYLVKFLENLMQNTSASSIEQAYPFLEHHGIPITEDGCFLAKKCVRSDYYDKYSGTMLNKPGMKVKVERNTVVDNPNRHCAAGIHVGASSYAGVGGWYWREGDKVLLVKVNPKDIVSVPTDHSFTKMRVCEYEVLCECEEELKRSVYSGLGINDENYDEDEYDDSDYCEEECDETFTLDPWQLRVDDCIEFEYEKEGTSSTRYAEVTEINTVDGYIITNLLTPEVDAGCVRRFNFDKMTDITLL